MNKCAQLALALATKPGTLSAHWACQRHPPRGPLLTSLWPLSAQAASQAQGSPAPIPGKSPAASLPGSPTSSRPASPGPDVSSKPSASSGSSGKRPFSPPTPSAESQDSKRVSMEQRIKSHTQGRGFPLLRPGSDPLMTRNCPQTYSFRSHDSKWW